jgi:hypothetical protein
MEERPLHVEKGVSENFGLHGDVVPPRFFCVGAKAPHGRRMTSSWRGRS